MEEILKKIKNEEPVSIVGNEIFDVIDYILAREDLDEINKTEYISTAFKSLDIDGKRENLLKLVDKILNIKDIDMFYLSCVVYDFIESITEEYLNKNFEESLNNYINPIIQSIRDREGISEYDRSELIEYIYTIFYDKLTKDDKMQRFQLMTELILSENQMSDRDKVWGIKGLYKSILKDAADESERHKLIDKFLKDRIIDDKDKKSTLEDLYTDRIKQIEDINEKRALFESSYREILLLDGIDESTRFEIIGGVFEDLPKEIMGDFIDKILEGMSKCKNVKDFSIQYGMRNIYKAYYGKILDKNNLDIDAVKAAIRKICVQNGMEEFDKAQCIIDVCNNCILFKNARDEVLNIIDIISECSELKYCRGYAIEQICVENIREDFYSIIHKILEQKNLPDYIKRDRILGIWKKNDFKRPKMDQIADIFDEIANDKAFENEDYNEYVNAFIDNFGSFNIEDNLDELIDQINSVKSDKMNKAAVYSRIVLNLCGKEEETDENIDKIMKILQEKGIDEGYDFSSRDAFIGNIVLNQLSGNFIDTIKDKYSYERAVIFRGLGHILKDETIDIWSNPDLMYLLNGFRQNLISLNNSEKTILDLLNKRAEQLPKPQNIEEYRLIIAENGVIPKDKEAHFLEQMKILRNADGKIPIDFASYIIKESIMEHIDKEQNETIIQQALIDVSQDFLKSLGIENYKISFDKLGAYTLGVHTSGNIRLSTDYFKKLNVSAILNTCFHECRHAYQQVAVKNHTIDKKFYKMLKENIIMDLDRSFYDRNYFNMENEFDARVYAAMKTYEFLLDAGMSAEDIAKYEDKTLEEELVKDKSENRDKKENKSEEVLSINDIICASLSNRGTITIQKLLKDNPMLNLEFELTDDGQFRKKDKDVLEKEFSEKMAQAASEEEQKKLTELYDYIINGEIVTDYTDVDYIDYLRDNGYEVSARIEEKLRRLKTLPDNQDNSEQGDVSTVGSILSQAELYYDGHTAAERQNMYRMLEREQDVSKEDR